MFKNFVLLDGRQLNRFSFGILLGQLCLDLLYPSLDIVVDPFGFRMHKRPIRMLVSRLVNPGKRWWCSFLTRLQKKLN